MRLCRVLAINLARDKLVLLLREHHFTHLVLRNEQLHNVHGLVCIAIAVSSHVALAPHTIRLDIIEGKVNLFLLLLARFRVV